MQNIISELIKIEQMANELLSEADEYAAKLPIRIVGAKQKISKDISERDTDNAKRAANNIVSETNERLAKIDKEHKNRVSSIRNLFNETHEAIEDEIFLRVIGKSASDNKLPIYTG